MASSSTKVDSYTRNSFSVDYSDYSSDETDEVEPPQRHPAVEVIVDAPRTSAVPESDSDSEIISISDDSAVEPESPTSSPPVHEEAGAPKIPELILDTIKMHEERRRALEVSDPNYAAHFIENVPIYEATSDQESSYADEDVFDESLPRHRSSWKARSPVETAPYPPDWTCNADTCRADHRQPSPSDAAMAKPPQPSTRAPPFAIPTVRLPGMDQITSRLSPDAAVEYCTRSPYAWAGQNSVLWEAPAVPRGGYPYCNDPEMAPAHQDYDWAATSQWNTPMPAEYQAESTRAPIPIQGFGESSVKAGKKRKLDEVEETTAMSNVSIPEQHKSTATEAMSNEAQVPESVNTGSQTYDLLPIEVTQTVESLKSPPAPKVASPRKKHKRSKDDTGARHTKKGSSFAKLAATALVGAAVGVAGTILGLVALPPDFFV